MERTLPGECDLNSLTCIAASKVPLNLHPESLPPRTRIALENMASDFISTIHTIRSKLTKIREEYDLFFGDYNAFVMRSDFIEDRDELYEDIRFHSIGISREYHALHADIPENCNWFGYLEYLKFNVFVEAYAFRPLLGTPHAVYTMAKGIINSVPSEPMCEMPVYLHDLYRGCTMYIRKMKTLVARYETMYSWEISAKRQAEYGQYLCDYDAEKNTLDKKLRENEEALSTCTLYAYPMFDDMSLDEILGFNEEVYPAALDEIIGFDEDMNMIVDDILFF